MRWVAFGVLVAGVAACDDPVPAPIVDFQIEAPLCSSIIPASLRIDGVQVGVDTFRVSFAPDRHRSRAFETTAGSHTLSVLHPNGVLIQEDSAVTLKAGDSYRFIFGFYCS